MPLFLIIVIASFLESLVAFVGGALAIFNEEKMRRAMHFVVSFAIGALLGVSLLELIPEAIKMSSVDAVFPLVFGGILLFFTLEKFLFWYHCHAPTQEFRLPQSVPSDAGGTSLSSADLTSPAQSGQRQNSQNLVWGHGWVCPVHTYTYLILWGDFLHNFIDGVIMALAFLADIKLGILTSVAVIAHEIPQEIGDFALLMHGGLARARALWLNFLSATSVMIGAVLTYLLGSTLEPFLPFGLALIAGNFIYLAATDLMPELHEPTAFSHSIAQILFIIIGALLVIAPEVIFG